MPSTEATRYIFLGNIVGPQGVHGAVRLHSRARGLPSLDSLQKVFVGEQRQRYALLAARRQGKALVLELEGCADHVAAALLTGAAVWVQAEDLGALQENEYYIADLVGLRVVTTEGEELGELVEVLVTGANDVYRVVGAAGEVLLPAIAQVVRNVDLPARSMLVWLMPGLRQG